LDTARQRAFITDSKAAEVLVVDTRNGNTTGFHLITDNRQRRDSISPVRVIERHQHKDTQ
ncbi:unnamed protein product, partial [marine sediment metagenome]